MLNCILFLLVIIFQSIICTIKYILEKTIDILFLIVVILLPDQHDKDKHP